MDVNKLLKFNQIEEAQDYYELWKKAVEIGDTKGARQYRDYYWYLVKRALYKERRVRALCLPYTDYTHLP